MKRALVLGSLLLWAGSLFAADAGSDRVADGKKRNEEIYERMLQQTGWTDPKESQQNHSGDKNQPVNATPSSQPKSS